MGGVVHETAEDVHQKRHAPRCSQITAERPNAKHTGTPPHKTIVQDMGTRVEKRAERLRAIRLDAEDTLRAAAYAAGKAWSQNQIEVALNEAGGSVEEAMKAAGFVQVKPAAAQQPPDQPIAGPPSTCKGAELLPGSVRGLSSVEALFARLESDEVTPTAISALVWQCLVLIKCNAISNVASPAADELRAEQLEAALNLLVGASDVDSLRPLIAGGRGARMHLQSLVEAAAMASRDGAAPVAPPPATPVAAVTPRAVVGFWDVTHTPSPASSFVGTMAGLGGLVLVEESLHAAGVVVHNNTLMLFLGAFGALSTLLYAAPAAPLGAPKNTIGGFALVVAMLEGMHFLNELTAEVTGYVVPVTVQKVVAPALGIAVMLYLKLVHPPAAACAIQYSTAAPSYQGLGFAVAPVMLGVGWMLLVQLCVAKAMRALHQPPGPSAASAKPTIIAVPGGHAPNGGATSPSLRPSIAGGDDMPHSRRSRGRSVSFSSSDLV